MKVKITPLWKRISEPPEIQTGCYRGDSRSAASLGAHHATCWLNKTVRGLRHWNIHLLSFWHYRCSVTLGRLRNNIWEVLITSPLLNNVRHRAMILCILGSFIFGLVSVKLFSKRVRFIGLEFKSNVLYKSIASKKHSVRYELYF